MRPAHTALLACVALLLGGLAPGPDSGTSVVEVMASNFTCFGAKEGRGTFNAPMAGDATAFRFVFVRGGVTCDKGISGRSHWGCRDNPLRGRNDLMMFLVNNRDDIVLPNHNTTGFTGFTKNEDTVYTLRNYNADSPELRLDGLSMWVEREQEFAVVYSEVLKKWTLADNEGETCTEIYMTYTVRNPNPTQQCVILVAFTILSFSLLLERGKARSEAVAQKQQVRCQAEPLEEERVKGKREREAVNSQGIALRHALQRLQKQMAADGRRRKGPRPSAYVASGRRPTSLGQELQRVQEQLAEVQREREAAGSQATSLGQELQRVQEQLAEVQREREAAGSQATSLGQELQRVQEQLAEVQRVVSDVPHTVLP